MVASAAPSPARAPAPRTSPSTGERASLALSNPCVELWFLLHFEERTAFIDRREAQRRATALGCAKVLTLPALDELIDRYDVAKRRAVALAAKHVGDGARKDGNPSSTAWRLIDHIREA